MKLTALGLCIVAALAGPCLTFAAETSPYTTAMSSAPGNEISPAPPGSPLCDATQTCNSCQSNCCQNNCCQNNCCQDCCCDDGCCDDGCCGNEFCTCPLWTARFGALIMHHSSPRSQLLATSGPYFAAVEAFNSKNLDPGWAGGTDLFVMRQLCNCWAVNARYFGFNGWTTNNTVTSPGILTFQGLGTTFSDHTLYFGDSARLYSSEMNLRRSCNNWLTLLGGFRWVQAADRFAAGDASGDSIYVSAVNNLYGMQIGANTIFRSANCRWWFNGTIKSGIFGNRSSVDSKVVLNDDPFSTVRPAFVGDINLLSGFQLTPRVAVYGGYQVLWIEGIAQAANQIDNVNVFTNTHSLDTHGGIFLHGASLGLQGTF